MKLILILCDALRYDRVNSKIMPNLTEFGGKGVSYTMFFADGGTTKYSLPFILSGKREFIVDDNFPKKLSRNEVHNCIIHSNAVLISEGFQKCFRSYRDVGVEMDPLKATLRNTFRKTFFWNKTRNLRRIITQNKLNVPYRRAENIFSIAQKQVDLYDNGFYWIHLMDSHIPYSPPDLSEKDEARTQELHDLMLKNIEGVYTFNASEIQELKHYYNLECSYMDSEIGKFVSSNPDCLFMVTSDHGEEFGEYKGFSHGPYYHGMILELGHTPLIVYGLNVKSHKIESYRSSINIGPTVLDFFNILPYQGYGFSMKEEILS